MSATVPLARKPETDVMVLSDLWQPFPGGAERLMFNVARHLEDCGLGVEVLTDYARAEQFDGPRVTFERMGVFDNRVQGAAVFRAYVERWEPRVILTHHLFANQYAPELAQLADEGLPIVQLVLNGQRYPWATVAVYISEWVAEQVGGLEPFDLVMTPPALPDCVASEHGEAIGFIKPLPHKGIELVYEIAENWPGRQFVILRGEWQDLEDIRLGRPNIEFMEPVDDIRDFYRRVDLVLMPSTSEDAGTVAQECALNRIPCISSDVGGLPETNAGGVRLHSRDVADWVGAIDALLSDPELYEVVVTHQAEALARYDHPGRLDHLAKIVRELACS